MFALIWLAAPAATGMLLTLLAPRRFRRLRTLLAFGLVVAIAVFFAAFLTAPPDYRHSQGDSDGEMFWGRWWEPTFVLFLVVVGALCWTCGTAAGLLVHAARARSRQRRDA